MLAKISLLSSFSFSVLYPLIFWISFRDPLKQNFHRFHLGLPAVIAGVTTFFILRNHYSELYNVGCVIWFLNLLLVTSLNWTRKTPKLYGISLVSIFGFSVFLALSSVLLKINNSQLFSFALTQLLSGLIFVASLFAMNLGHWYLNVHGLPIKHLINATLVLFILLLARLLWCLSQLFTTKIFFDGWEISLLEFIKIPDGYLVGLAFLFGLIFPLISLFFVKGTLALKNTQATTGILYVILCSVILGDIVFKYYLVKFGIIL